MKYSVQSILGVPIDRWSAEALDDMSNDAQLCLDLFMMVKRTSHMRGEHHAASRRMRASRYCYTIEKFHGTFTTPSQSSDNMDLVGNLIGYI